MAGASVAGIMKSLGALEDDMDSLDARTAEMKKQLVAMTRAETDSLLGRIREMASKEAGSLVEEAKKKATAESEEVARKGEERLAEIRSKIEANYEQAVEHVVSAVLKA